MSLLLREKRGKKPEDPDQCRVVPAGRTFPLHINDDSVYNDLVVL